MGVGVSGSLRKVVPSALAVSGVSAARCHRDVTQRDVASAAEVPVSSGLFTLKSHLLQNLLCLIKMLSLQHLYTRARED